MRDVLPYKLLKCLVCFLACFVTSSFAYADDCNTTPNGLGCDLSLQACSLNKNNILNKCDNLTIIMSDGNSILNLGFPPSISSGKTVTVHETAYSETQLRQDQDGTGKEFVYLPLKLVKATNKPDEPVPVVSLPLTLDGQDVVPGGDEVTLTSDNNFWIPSGPGVVYLTPASDGISTIPTTKKPLTIYTISDGRWAAQLNLPSAPNYPNYRNIVVVHSDATQSSTIKPGNVSLKTGQTYAFGYDGWNWQQLYPNPNQKIPTPPIILSPQDHSTVWVPGNIPVNGSGIAHAIINASYTNPLHPNPAPFCQTTVNSDGSWDCGDFSPYGSLSQNTIKATQTVQGVPSPDASSTFIITTMPCCKKDIR
jgi:hypothetical protein